MLTVALIVPPDDVELASDRLWSRGAQAVEERDEGQRVRLVTTLGSDAADTRERLGELPEAWTLEFEHVDITPAQTWRQHARPTTLANGLTLMPAWLVDAADATAMVIAIEPGAAFGLGDHPTTRLTAETMTRLITPGISVLDVGCGTGVLSIVAARLGAGAVAAVDISAAAIEATIDNARRNGVSDRIRATTTPLQDIEGCFDLVVANILAPTLVALADDLRRLTAPGGTLVIAGILDGAHDHVTAALAPMRPRRDAELDGWAVVELGHGEAAEGS